jgi:FkbM family methyltransferase
LRRGIPKAIKLSRLLAEPSYRRALVHGVAATTEHETVAFRPAYATVIDVGANRGQFALFALKRFPAARVLCFEPLPAAYGVLARTVGGDPRVRLEQCALGAVGGVLDLNVSESDDSSSLLAPTDLQLDAFPGTSCVASVPVKIRRLDDAVEAGRIAEPFLLKIDVQGFELDVLRGASRLLEGDGDLLVEASFAELYAGQPLADEVVAALLSQGYRLRGIFSVVNGRDGHPLQADFMFSRA